MYTLIILGGASKNKLHEIKLNQEDLNCKLMNFLQNQKINIASSCGGEGVCQKCVVWQGEKKLLSCQISLFELFKNTQTQTLSISYL